MFTDMVGYSALAQADEAAALKLLERHNRLLRPVFKRFGGREVKTVGDAFLVEFGSALAATQCAVEIQRLLREYNASSTESWRIRIRIGIHVGDVVETKGDVLGDAVNIASRIEPLAEPDGICVSQQVLDQVQNKVAVRFLPMPPRELKNIRNPVTVYRLGPSETGSPGPVGAAPRSAERRLAVLPLSNISPDASDEYFADGLTEELISVLSHIPGLSVIARTSVIPYKTAPKSIAQVGAELGIDTALEGSVRKSGPRLRISLQLVDVASQRHLWAETYNREIDDVFAVQADVAARTAEALRLELAPSSSTGRRDRPTHNTEAYDLYLRALVDETEPFGRGFEPAFRKYEQATQLDPEFAEAYASWANSYVRAAGDYLPLRTVMPRARELVGKALALDPDSSSAHATLGNIALQFDGDWERAEAEFQRAIALNPSNLRAHRYYGLLLMSQQRFDEAKEVLREAMRLDPSGDVRYSLAWADASSGDYDGAIRLADEALTVQSDSVTVRVFRGGTYLRAGQREMALKEASIPLPADPSDDERFDHALLNAVLDRPAEARKIVKAVERGQWKSYLSPAYLAMLYATLGEGSRALDLLEKDYREGDRVLWLWYREIYFDSIRNDPRFVALLRAYRVPTYVPIRKSGRVT